MIEVKGLTKTFAGHPVLRGVDLSVEQGQVTAVIGPSGSGKTTLLRCLDCLEAPSAGVIRVGEIQIDGAVPLSRQKAQVRALRQSVGFVFQSFNLFPHRTALENVIEGPVVVRREPRAAAEERGRALLAKVGLGAKADAYPSELSGGQQQRVAIARALGPGSGAGRRGAGDHPRPGRRTPHHDHRHSRNGLRPRGGRPDHLHGRRCDRRTGPLQGPVRRAQP